MTIAARKKLNSYCGFGIANIPWFFIHVSGNFFFVERKNTYDYWS